LSLIKLAFMVKLFSRLDIGYPTGRSCSQTSDAIVIEGLPVVHSIFQLVKMIKFWRLIGQKFASTAGRNTVPKPPWGGGGGVRAMGWEC
jgi:hypothetical protein